MTPERPDLDHLFSVTYEELRRLAARHDDIALEVFDVDPYTGFWRRFGISLLSILPIESQL